MAIWTTPTRRGAGRLPAPSDPAWLLVLALALGFFWNLGGPPLFDRDEGAFSEATREMLARGDYVSTWLHGQPRYDKPILIYWCQAACVTVLGPREVAFRLPSAIFAALWVLAVVHFARPRLGRTAALTAGALMATALGVMSVGRAAIADALLNLCLTLAMLDLYRYREAPRRRVLDRIFLWSALGFLTKGPVALLVPAGVGLVLYGLERRWRDWLHAILDPRGLAILLVVAAPWYLLQIAREGEAFLRGFFLTHNVNRFAGPMEGHGGGLIYYFVVFPLAALPHTALLLRQVPGLRRAAADPLDRFCWVWTGFVLLFFTFSGTKLPHYVYLGMAPLFLLMGRHRERLRSRALAVLPALMLLGLLAGLPWLLPAVRERLGDPLLRAQLAPAGAALGPLYRALTVAGLVAVAAVGLWRGLPAWRASLLAGLVTACVVAQGVAPAIGEILQGPVKAAALRSRELDVPVVMWDLDNPSLGVYRRAVLPDRPPRPGEACITRITNLPRLSGAEVLYRRGAIVLTGPLPGSSPPDAPPPGTAPD